MTSHGSIIYDHNSNLVIRGIIITSKQRAQKILDVAFLLFARQGIRKTTIEQIAAAAGIGKGTIYLSFKSKDEIFTAIIRREAHLFFQTLRRAVRREQSAVGQLRTYIQTSIRSVADLMDTYRVSQELREESRHYIETLRQELLIVEQSIIEGIIEFGCEQGEFRVADIPFVSITIAIAIHTLEAPWLYPGYEVNSEEKADDLLNLFINGIRCR